MTVRQDPIAVIGMACRFPQSADVQAFWQLLLDGRDAVHTIPPDRWNLEALKGFHEGRPLPKPALEGGWLDRVRDFDHVFFRMSPREARTMDPKQRLSLEVTYEAFEDAGLSPAQARGTQTVGMFLGTAQSEYLMRFYFRGELTGSKADRYSGPGNDASFSSGRISAMFGLEGPSVNLNTACSTSLVAVHQAMRAIHDGECDVAAAGGVTIIESPEHSLVMNQFGVLSPEARCKAFDASADGYVRAEGCGVVVLKRLSRALADGDRVWAVLTGSAVNHNGLSDNLMAPDTGAQIRLIRRALHQAELEPDAVDVIEAHGTGTSAGDPTEIHALADIFGARGAQRPLHVASVKTNIGHLEVTAGIAGLIKAVLSVHHGQIPGHLHLRTLNPAISPDLPFVYPKHTTPWPGTGRRHAVVNSFGISGINAAVVISQAPSASEPVRGSARPVTVLPISAQGEPALRALAAAYAAHLEQGANLHDVAWSAARGRDPLPTRLAVLASTAAEASSALRAAAAGQEHPALRKGEARGGVRVGWLFTGQGAQHPGMGKALYASEPAYREALDRVDATFAPHLGCSIRAVLHGEDTSRSLDDTGTTQPALFAMEWALASLWSRFGVEPSVMVGHSIGEIVAATYAGVFSLEDAARLVAHRARLMSALPREGAMAALFTDVDTVRAALVGVEGVDIGADNGPTATVISGRTQGVLDVLAAFEARGIAGRQLKVSHAFHSPLMEPMLAEFGAVVASIPMQAPRLAIVSNLDGRVADASMATADYWVRHVRHAVRFREGVVELARQGVEVVLELGPDATAIGMARRCLKDVQPVWLASHQKEEAEATLAHALATLYVKGAIQDWSGPWQGHEGRRVDLPRYPFQRREHWVEDPGPSGGATTAPVPAPPAAAAAASPREDAPGAYRMRWTPIPPPPVQPVPVGTWIVGIDRSGVGSQLARGLEASGHRVVRVVPAEHDGPLPNGTHGLSLASASGFRDLVAQHAMSLRGWVHTWSLDLSDADPTSAAGWTSGQAEGSLATLFAAQAIAGSSAQGAALVTLTRGAEAVRPGARPRLAQAGPWGVARVLALEHRAVPNLRIDLDPAGGGEEQVLGWLLARPLDEDQLALRQAQVLGLRLVRHTPSGARLRPTPGTSWILTGGLGALGLAVAEHLAALGVTHLTLVGRSAPTAEAEAAMARMQARGVQVRVAAVDVADPAAVAALVHATDAQAPLRGVIHAAGILADGPILTQDRERFLRVFPAKVEGAWNLHLATRNLPLDAFVLFSSVTSSLGAPGQVNYAAANAFMDALAWRRHHEGLPAVSINWGPWGEVGMAARLSELMASRGMGGLRTADGVAALTELGGDLLPQVSYMDIRLRTLAARDPAFVHAPLMRELVAGLSVPTPPRTEAPRPPALSTTTATAIPVAGAAAPSDRAALLGELVRYAEELLGFRPGELDPGRPLAWQGFDSVMAIDLHKRIRAETGADVPLDRVLPGPRLAELVDEVLPRVTRRASSPAPTPPPAQPTPSPATPAAAPAAAPVTADRGVWTAEVAALVEELLGFRPGEIDVQRPLAWQGFDSVMAIDLRKRLVERHQVEIPLDRLLHGPKVTEIVDELLSRGGAPRSAPAAPVAPAPAATPPAPVAFTPAPAPPPIATAPQLPSMPAEEPGSAEAAPALPVGVWIVAGLLVAGLFFGALWLTTDGTGTATAVTDDAATEEPGARRKRRQP